MASKKFLKAHRKRFHTAAWSKKRNGGGRKMLSFIPKAGFGICGMASQPGVIVSVDLNRSSSLRPLDLGNLKVDKVESMHTLL